MSLETVWNGAGDRAWGQRFQREPPPAPRKRSSNSAARTLQFLREQDRRAGHTSKELSDLVGVSIAMINKITSDLRAAGKLVFAGVRQRQGSGRTSRAFRLKEEFRLNKIIVSSVDVF